MVTILLVRSSVNLHGLWLIEKCLETAIPYHEFKKAGWEIDFVTERGNSPECDAKMLTGMTQKMLVGVVAMYVQGYTQTPSLFSRRVLLKKFAIFTTQCEKTWPP